ncbi:MAG: hypothetical protein LBV50_05110 [Novosphingobium sp.]|nr:hypothetical protein [Novosphingobium sp.]
MVWYRLTFDGSCAQGEPLAVWIDFLNMAGAVYLNDALLDRDESLVEPLTRAWNTPRFALLPAPLVAPHDNRLLVRVSGISAYQPGLGPVAIGDASAVRPLYNHSYRLRRDFQLYNLAITLTLGGFFLLVWLLRRRERMFGWYALQSFAWALVVVNQTATSVWPFSGTNAWEKANSIVFLIFSAGFTMFALAFAGRRLPRLQTALWALTACQIAAILLAPHTLIEPVRAIVLLIPATTFIITCIAFIVFAAISRRAEHLALAACMLFFIGTGIHDTLQFLGVLAGNIYYNALTSQATMIAMAFLLAWRFVAGMKRIEGFNTELAGEITAARSELRQTLERQHALEVANARLGERLALANDLHDGLGSTLMHNIVALEQTPRDESAERLLTILRVLRDDLQDIIETVSADPAGPLSLIGVIAPLRHRITRSFEALGVTCRWTLPGTGPGVAAADEVRLTDARVSADVMRLVQEGLTNALRHSGASRVDVELAAEGTALAISIRDNGRGFDPAAVPAGLGLRSMQTRTRRLGGTFAVRSSGEGTELRFTLPCVVRDEDGRSVPGA